MRFRTLLPAALLAATFSAALAQEGPLPTQALLRASKEIEIPQTLTLKVDDHPVALTSLTPVTPNGTQIALLIDDGLTRNAGVQLSDIKDFITTLPPATEILLGYMRDGTVEVLVPFTTDHAAVAAKVRIPVGLPGISASPYFCLSEFVKHWPGNPDREAIVPRAPKARFALMITNGVDPYNGSTSPLNQDSPYVLNAISDAQKAGVAVSSIYYRDAGFRGGNASFSGQSYLEQVSQGTGGESYYLGLGSPVSLSPFFKQFTHAISETYIATFNATADSKDHLVRFKAEAPKLKIRHPEAIRPGNIESGNSAATNREGAQLRDDTRP